MSKPILCLDFDSCIHLYSKGWADGSIYDPVVPGFFEWAAVAREHFRLVIYSSRSKTPEGIEAMRLWLMSQLLTNECQNLTDSPLYSSDFEFAHEKPPAFLTIDDRAMQFRGNWDVWWLDPTRLIEFKPWNVEGATECPIAKHEPMLIDAIGTEWFRDAERHANEAIAILRNNGASEGDIVALSGGRLIID